MERLVELKESRRVDIVEIVEHDTRHGHTSAYFVQGDVIIRVLEQTLDFVVPVKIPLSSSHLMYTASVSKTLSRFRQTLTLCYNEQTPNPCRWIWLTVVLANVKNKSSWIDLYIWVWDSRKKIRDHFSASLGYHFSSSEPTPKVEQQRQYFCRAEQSKTPLGRCRRPFVKISSHENMGSSQKVAKTRFFA